MGDLENAGAYAHLSWEALRMKCVDQQREIERLRPLEQRAIDARETLIDELRSQLIAKGIQEQVAYRAIRAQRDEARRALAAAEAKIERVMPTEHQLDDLEMARDMFEEDYQTGSGDQESLIAQHRLDLWLQALRGALGSP